MADSIELGGQPINLDEIEAILRRHPGVRDAAVAISESTAGQGQHVSFVVADSEFLRSLLTGAEADAQRVRKWRSAFALVRKPEVAGAAQPGFYISGWSSSYTGGKIPDEEMREWIEATVARIQSLRPRRVLEIGCGTGLLLLRIAPGCERYIGVDLASSALQSISEQMERIGGKWDHVALFDRPAHDLHGITPDAVDTVILNSVVQYFPGADYLLKVIEQAAQAVSPDGTILVGDVYSLPLLEAFDLSIETHKAAGGLAVTELIERARRRALNEEQMSISPAFFLALRGRVRGISRVEIMPRRGHFRNEMTQFRYDAILHIGGDELPEITPDWRDWTGRPAALDTIRTILEHERPAMLAIKGITNARVSKETAALARLSVGASGTVADFRATLDGSVAPGVDPEELWILGAELGYAVELSWAACRTDGSFDACLRRVDEQSAPLPPIAWPEPEHFDANLESYTNRPGQSAKRRILTAQLREHARANLAAQINLTAFIFVDALPRMSTGAVDRAALIHTHLAKS